MTDVKYEHPGDNERLDVRVYVVKCALPSEQTSGNYSPGKPHIQYDRFFHSIGDAKRRQKELMDRHGFQSFWTVNESCFGAFI